MSKNHTSPFAIKISIKKTKAHLVEVGALPKQIGDDCGGGRDVSHVSEGFVSFRGHLPMRYVTHALAHLTKVLRPCFRLVYTSTLLPYLSR